MKQQSNGGGSSRERHASKAHYRYRTVNAASAMLQAMA